jgi:membrane-associated protease RseP (regulator of RpoE activity)
VEWVLGTAFLIVVLVVSVALHEFGHFIPARLFKVPVSQFMVGFGRTIWSRRVGDTEFGFKWLPLGGYVRLIGMYPPTPSPKAAKTGWRRNLADAARELTTEQIAELARQSDRAAAHDADQPVPAASGDLPPVASPGQPGPAEQFDRAAQLEPATDAGPAAPPAADAGPAAQPASRPSPPPPSPQAMREISARAFYNLSAPRKLVVMLGGPMMNLILALILTGIAISTIGLYGASTTVDAVSQCLVAADDGSCEAPSPAAVAGVQAGDQLVAWNGERLDSWEDVVAAVTGSAETPATLTVDRDGRRLDLSVEPVTVLSETGQTRAVIGVSSRHSFAPASLLDAPAMVWDQVTASAKLYASLPVAVWETLVDMVEGRERALDSPVSMVGVARIAGEAADPDFAGDADEPWKLRWAFWLQLAASVNIALWLFNLLPLLPLDGGHIVNAVYEGGRRQVARWRGKPDPGNADSARLMPLSYAVIAVLILMTVVLLTADLVNPPEF